MQPCLREDVLTMTNSPNQGAPRASFPTPTLAEDILNAIETLVTVVNGNGEIVYVSPAVKRILGYEVAEVLGQGWWGRVYSGDPTLAEVVRERITQTALGIVPISPESHTAKAFTASGEERCIVWRDAKGPGDLMIGVGQDITELQNAEKLAERHEREFSTVFENASDGMLILDEDWIYEEANDSACRIFGLKREEIIGRKLGDVKPASTDFADFRERALREGTARMELAFQRDSGERRELEVSARANFRPGHHLIVQRDITDQKRLQTQLSKAHRLESVGRLAGGVAHDFNNMLTAIRGYAELLQRIVTDEKPKRYVEAILGAASRAADTTQRLLAFSRKQMLKPQVLDLNEGIIGTVDLLQRVIGEDVELVLLLSPEAGKVMVDPAQFSQILMNLAVNGRDAMPGGGKLIIETRAIEIDDEYVLKHIHVQPGHYALMAVTDTGTGIPPEIMSHIFEPFFTTKEQGKGTGLGLATVYGIVTQSGGYVWVYSEPGQGSTFKIYFPFVENETSDGDPRKATILVIEDDEVTRMVTVQALEDDGYKVLSACDGTEALAICQQWSKGIDLVLTDVMASGMSGEDLMGYFAVKFPALAVVHMSGFARARLEQAHTFFPDALFLSKPFTVAQLREKIQVALQRRAGASPDPIPE